jgi:hypothetical protein
VLLEGEDRRPPERAHVEIAVGGDQLVVPARGLRDDLALRVDDDRVAEQLAAILRARLRHAHAEARVLVAAGLDRQVRVEHAQMMRLEPAGLLVDARRVVAEHDQLNLLQAEHAPAFRPAAVVADHHPHVDAVEPAHRRADHREAEIAHLEIALLQVLHLALRVELGVPGQMHLAVFQQDLAGRADQDRGIEVPPAHRAGLVRLVRDLRVAEMEADIVALRRLEQRRGLVRGHRRLEPVIGLRDILVVVAREEGGQRELGEHHELHAAPVGALHQRDHAGHGDRARLGFLDRAELRGADGDDAGHPLSPQELWSQWLWRLTKRPVPGVASTLAPSHTQAPRR